MTPRAYYNEHDPFAAAWLRNLIAAGHLMSGDVDERDIQDVQPSDLVGYTRCHFFAGIGGWDYALRLSEWPDDEPIWTGSCPCQPFSAAGQGAGFADERHLWPAFYWLITQCQPRYVVGEQVASADALRWWDLVATDLEGAGYACAAVDLPAASVGAPHKRQRLFWVAEASGERRDWEPVCLRAGRPREAGAEVAGSGEPRPVAHATGERWERGRAGQASHQSSEVERPERLRVAGDMADPISQRGRGRESRCPDAGHAGVTGQARRFWADCDWLPCTDGTARPVESGTFPLAHGVPTRVGRLRGYGNAIVPQAAAEVLRAFRKVTR